jgi:hypothetical protein
MINIPSKNIYPKTDTEQSRRKEHGDKARTNYFLRHFGAYYTTIFLRQFECDKATTYVAPREQ